MEKENNNKQQKNRRGKTENKKQCWTYKHQSVTDSTGTLAPFYIVIKGIYTHGEKNLWLLQYFRYT